MPLYEYQCDVCGHRFEKIQKFSDAPIDVCPSCGGVVRKLMSAPAFQLKGTGWYATDYAKKDSGGGAASGQGKDSKSSDTAAKTDAGSTTDKPAAASGGSSTPATPPTGPKASS